MSERIARSYALTARLRELPVIRTGAVIHSYVGIGTEVPTLPLIEELLARGVRIACPAVIGRGHLEQREISSTSELRHRQSGLLEPDQALCPALSPSELDAVLVPGLAFTRRGHRLGYGGGYYDAFLACCSAQAIGVAFESQLVESVPVGAHDWAVDIVVTEARTIRTGARA